MKANNLTNISHIPEGFTVRKGGFANDVYQDKKHGLILKIYSEKSYYKSEISAFNSGFDYMPKFIKNGSTEGRPYIIMTSVGTGLRSFTKNDVTSLAQTLSRLHKIKKQTPRRLIEKRFRHLQQHATDIKKIIDIDIHQLIKRISRYTKSKSTSSLTHGDITLSNLRKVSGEIFLIDFDEATYSSPYFDIAKLYWSGLIPLQTLTGLKHFIHEYNKIGQTSLTLGKEAKDWIIFAGIDFWIWRVTHIRNNTNLIKQAEGRLIRYRKKYGH
ncbi:MAG: aminoglycoside phosphotransferase family protein [Candidatus Moranbacteria bacterium]|nr:aminoglycoside phosphotransferase family protein [Candidatus Moranbacteria bacterium]MDD3964822.1 aminoglycoside phosphotransferase family protein [Candidatus Moranbacteria bacterium]